MFKVLGKLSLGSKKETDLPINIVENPVSLKNEAIVYWKVYFDFTYYLCLLPFRFKFNISTRTYDETKWRAQKVCKALIKEEK